MQGQRLIVGKKEWWCPVCRMATYSRHVEHGGSRLKVFKKSDKYKKKTVYFRKNGREVSYKVNH